jgi:hypothetical protein
MRALALVPALLLLPALLPGAAADTTTLYHRDFGGLGADAGADSFHVGQAYASDAVTVALDCGLAAGSFLAATANATTLDVSLVSASCDGVGTLEAHTSLAPGDYAVAFAFAGPAAITIMATS